MTISRWTASAQSGSDADANDCPEVTIFETHANFRNHPGDFCQDPGHFVNNLEMANLMKSGQTHCNQPGHSTAENVAAAALEPHTKANAIVAAPAALSEAAIGYMRQALSPATRRVYGSHLRAWEAWCRCKGIAPAPAVPALVANHLAELAGKRAYVTLTSRLSAIVQAHALLRLPFDNRDPELRKTLQGIARAYGTQPKRQAASLLTADVIKVAACGGDALGRQGLAAESIRLILKERARQAGYRGKELARITPHSLRAGCITTLAQASVHERDIMQHSRHGSQAVMRTYIRAAGVEEAFTSDALWRCKNEPR